MRIVNQHGDVLLVAIDAIPEGAQALAIKPGFVVERGEGAHEHTIEDVSGVEVLTIGDRMFLRVSEPTTITHEEHGPQVIEPGLYEKDIEQVFDYENEIERRVQD